MVRTKKRYNKLAFNFLLSVTYFFLFAIQLSGKFYTIANFFVYSSSNLHHASVVNPRGNDISPNDPSFVLLHTKSLPDGLHLSLDKRYHARHPQVAVASSDRFGIEPVSCEIRKSYYTEPARAISFSLITTSLRGPPCA